LIVAISVTYENLSECHPAVTRASFQHATILGIGTANRYSLGSTQEIHHASLSGARRLARKAATLLEES
jgi:hypothetical protein